MLFALFVVSIIWPGPHPAPDTFSGVWSTTFGEMSLTQTGNKVAGFYAMDGEQCTIEGTIEKRRLTFTYQESSAAGEGWFELAPGARSFAGQWRPTNGSWDKWTGKRLLKSAAAVAKPAGFSGLWETTYGRMRLIQNGDKVTGIYSREGGSTIEGTVEGNKLKLHYKEPDAKGEAVFELSIDEKSFKGIWNEAGSKKSSAWNGKRVEPKPGIVWLVVVEARWENSITEDEYTFGAMLKAYFARTPKVQMRHRIFTDEASLKRWCGEMAYIAEPAVLVVAAHGSTKGVAADGKTVSPKALADSLKYASNIKLLHFSACEIMRGKAAESIAAGIEKPSRFPISGYTTSVDWAASAIIEFAYLDMVLARRMAPAKAAEQLKKNLPFSGSNAVPGSVFGNAGFRLLNPEEVK